MKVNTRAALAFLLAGVAAGVREVVNPARLLLLSALSILPTARGLALAAYEERELPSGHLDSLRLAVLADAVEEAGGRQSEAGRQSPRRDRNASLCGDFAKRQSR